MATTGVLQPAAKAGRGGGSTLTGDEGDHMKKTFSGILVAALAFAGVVGTSTKAAAACNLFVCNDASCTGGDDYSVADNATNNTLGLTGDENAMLNNIAVDG